MHFNEIKDKLRALFAYTMMSPSVFVSRQLPTAGLELLRSQGFTLDIWEGALPPPPTALLERCQNASYLLCLLSDPISAEFLEASKHLKAIATFAVGFNNIHVDKATQLGIPVGNTPDVLTDASSDLALALMLAAGRKLVQANQSIYKGEWKTWEPLGFLGLSFKNKCLGIVGMGRIGQDFARKCKAAWNMQILYYSREAKPEIEKELGAKKVELPELLAQSDIVSLHASLNDSTRGLFGYEQFRQMKSSALFMNTARGEMHKEDDLVRALQEKLIWGAALDVTNPEPPQLDNPLLHVPNALVLPHIASATEEAREKMSIMAAQNLIAASKGEKMPFPVNFK